LTRYDLGIRNKKWQRSQRSILKIDLEFMAWGQRIEDPHRLKSKIKGG
jgi:hypothetical protein